MNRRILGAVASLLLASLGTFVLIAFVRSAEDRAVAGEALVPVVVVKERIPAGTPAGEIGGRVAVERVPAKVRSADAVDDVAALESRVAAIDLLPGEQITATRFVNSEAVRPSGVSVPQGLLEVTVSLEPERAVGGVIRPGGTVGVLASFEPFEISSEGPFRLDGVTLPKDAKSPNSTHLILHKVLVTRVQSDTTFKPKADDVEATAPAPSGNLLVTLALDAPSVERVVFAAEHGTLWLANEPRDAAETGTRVQTRGSVNEETTVR